MTTEQDVKDFLKKFEEKQGFDKYYQTIDLPFGYKIQGGLKYKQKQYQNWKIWKQISEIYDFKNKKVADIGCFNGYFCFEIKKLAKIVHGFDKCIPAISTAREIAKLKEMDIKFDVFDVDKEEIKEEYDVILLLNALQYLKNPELVFNKIFPKTKTIILEIPFVKLQPHWSMISKEKLFEIAEKHNFKLKKEFVSVRGGLTILLFEKQGLVTFIFDDGNDVDYTVMKPVFDKQGEVACSSIISDNIGNTNFLTPAQLIEMEDDGWEILSHSETHPDLTTLNEEQIRTELLDSKQALEAMGLTINNFVYPFHKNNEIVRKITKEYYKSARGGPQGINPEMLEIYSLSSYMINVSTKLSSCKSYVDIAENEKKWMIFYLHGANAKNAVNNPVKFINELIDYIQTKNINIVTVNQALDLLIGG